MSASTIRVGAGPHARASHHERAMGVLAGAAAVLGRAQLPATGVQITDQLLMKALGRTWRQLIARLANGHTDLERTRRCVDLLDEIRGCEEMFRRALLARVGSSQRGVREALAELHGLTSIDELVTAVPAVVGRMGYDRVLLSRIENCTWVPESMFVSRSPAWAEDIVQAGRRHLRRLDDGLLEDQMLRQRRPLLVHDVAGRTHLHRELVIASRTSSYVAAPITVDDQVIGLLHADHYWAGQRARHHDGETLWLFTAGLTHVIAAISALTAINDLRGQIEHVTRPTSFEANPDLPRAPMAEPPRPLVATTPTARLVAPSTGGANEALTARETDVIRLMGEGCTNSQIGRQLMISEGTVKSHVKHILAKTGAANRAEAVAVWLRHPTTRARVPTNRAQTRG